MTNERSFVGIVRELLSDATLLVRQEVSLARAEAEEKLEQVQTGVIAIGAGLVLAGVALLVLVQALVVALANFMAPSLAALLVGVILAAIAYFSVSAGTEQLKTRNLAPRRTIKSVRASAEAIKEAS